MRVEHTRMCASLDLAGSPVEFVDSGVISWECFHSFLVGCDILSGLLLVLESGLLWHHASNDNGATMADFVKLRFAQSSVCDIFIVNGRNYLVPESEIM